MAEDGRETRRRTALTALDRAVTGAGQVLFGRAPERERIGRIIAEAPDGFTALLLVGEHGIGKSALLDHAVVAARRKGRRVLCARLAPAEGDLPYLALSDLLAEVEADEFTALPTPQRAALESIALQSALGDVSPLFAALALRLLLQILSDDQAVVVAVDDLDRTDPWSARVLALCLCRLGSAAVGFLATARAEGVLPAAFQPLWADRSTRTHEVGPLEPAALAAIAREHAHAGLAAGAVHTLGVLSRGNPRAAIDLCRELNATGPLPRSDRIPLPEGLRRRLATRLDALPARTRKALQAAAALHEPTVAAVTTVTGGTADDLGPAITAGVVRVRSGRVRFGDPALASAAYMTGDPAELRKSHRRLSVALRDPEERLWQLAHGADEPDEQVASALQTSAERLGRRGLPAQAAELAEVAVRLTPAGRARAAMRRARTAAAHHLTAGDEQRSVGLLERAAREARRGDERASVVAELARTRAYSGSLSPALALLDVAVSEAKSARVRSAVYRDLAWVTAGLGEPVAARRHARSALVFAQATRAPMALGAALAVRALVDVLAGSPPETGRLDRALELEADADPDDLLPLPVLCRPTLVAGLFEIRTGRPDRPRASLYRLERDLTLRGDVCSLAAVHTVLAELECAAAAWEKAEHYADDALDAPCSALFRPWALSVRAAVRAHRGDIGGARDDAAAGARTARAAGAAPFEALNCAVLALAALVDGQPETAHRMLAPLLPDEIGDPAFVPWVATAVEALVQLGQLDEAEALLDPFERRARDLVRPAAALAAARCRGLLLAARGQRAEAEAVVQGALQGYGWARLPLKRARTLLLLGQLLRGDNQKLAARQILKGALAELERLGATTWANQAAAELQRTRELARAAFTAAEQQVVELVVKGHTTREIAARLFVSVRTVESHLTSVYRKAGVRGRGELVYRLIAPGA